ncbi:MAG: UpxY family transcription antiterminator [Desulfobacula sp.]|nr:UpxY family transcription antiterminator [Desulfobacula sp.]
MDLFHWFALLTRSNFEKKTYDILVQKKIPTFLPKIKRKSIRKDRNLMVEAPLFPGYIFVQSSFKPKDQLNVLKTVGAVRLLGNQNGPIPVPEFQIESLRILTNSNVDLISGTSVQLRKGDPVMIIEGPLAGVKGEFIHYKGESRVVIRVEVLGQYAGTEIDESKVEKLPDILV